MCVWRVSQPQDMQSAAMFCGSLPPCGGGVGRGVSPICKIPLKPSHELNPPARVGTSSGLKP
jgi:hypothetical protein